MCRPIPIKGNPIHASIDHDAQMHHLICIFCSLKRKLKELQYEDEEVVVPRHRKLSFISLILRSTLIFTSYIPFFVGETTFASTSAPEPKLLGYDDSANNSAKTKSSNSSINNQQMVAIKARKVDDEPVVSKSIKLSSSCLLNPFLISSLD